MAQLRESDKGGEPEWFAYSELCSDFPPYLAIFPQQFSMADTSMTSHSKNKHDPEEMDPRWKSYPLKQKQSQVFDKKVLIYLDEYRQLNPWLVSWKQIKQEDQNALVALQNTLIRDIFNHACFNNSNLIDLNMHSWKQWEVCLVNLFF